MKKRILVFLMALIISLITVSAYAKEDAIKHYWVLNDGLQRNNGLRMFLKVEIENKI